MNKPRLNTKLLRALENVLLMQVKEIIRISGFTTTTWYRIMSDPEKITVQQLLTLANSLHIPVRRFFFTGKTGAVGDRKDYVVEPYLECYYDGDAIKQFIERTPGATWQKAAVATGITRDWLRKSLLGAVRTPITRFLSACFALEIDPFTVLIDPNPAAGMQADLATVEPDDLASEVATLRRSMARMSSEMADLKAKLRALLDDDQHNVRNIPELDDEVDMAAESEDE